MQNEQNLQEATINPATTPATAPTQEMTGGLSIRTDLRAGISVDEIQGQLQDWWQNISSAMSLPGADATQAE